MRKYHSLNAGMQYVPITADDDDPRANRITAYLNLLNHLVSQQVDQLRQSPFEPGSEITRYYEMLPESPPKEQYRAMLEATDPEEKQKLQIKLRREVVPGSIDASIMTKVDSLRDIHGAKPPPEYSDAKAALRGFARSEGLSSIVCSAGINAFLYKYFTNFKEFYPDENGEQRKKITIKVSDYRSAEFQGNFLAKLGLWVSEYRIESGLNCGGHAFPTKGLLLGPILQVFLDKRDELRQRLYATYRKALTAMGRTVPADPPESRLTVQGGIRTAEEDNLLHTYYQVDGTGWGTPLTDYPSLVGRA